MNTHTGVDFWLDMPILEMCEWHEEVQQTIKDAEAQAQAEAEAKANSKGR